MYGYSQGVTRDKVNRIREMNQEGKAVEEISRALLVVPTCVQSFVDKFNKKPRKNRSSRQLRPEAVPPPEKEISKE